MHDRLQSAFAYVRAEESLKAKALVAATRPRRRGMHPLAWAAVCLLLLVGLGGAAFFTPVSAISMDVNPSLELTVNCFDRVIKVEGYNEKGWEMAKSANLLFAEYTQALNDLLSSIQMQGYLEKGENLSIFVACDDEQRSTRMLAQVEACTGQGRNIHCRAGGWEECAAAHEVGLSHGKYLAFLELQALDPSATPEEVQGLTMREIRRRIAELSGEDAPAYGCEENCCNGAGHRHRHGGNDTSVNAGSNPRGNGA